MVREESWTNVMVNVGNRWQLSRLSRMKSWPQELPGVRMRLREKERERERKREGTREGGNERKRETEIETGREKENGRGRKVGRSVRKVSAHYTQSAR